MTTLPGSTITESFGDCLRGVGIPVTFAARFDDDAQDNLQAYISASAPSTLYGFRSDVARWIAACVVADADPLAPRARDVRDFIREFENGRKPPTVKRMIANIGVLTNGILGNKNVCQTKVVQSEMKRLRREHGSQHKQALAIRQLGAVVSMDDPAMPFSIERMLAALEPNKSLTALRGKLLLSLGGDTGRRNSEYRGANFGHLAAAPGAAGTFHVDRSKTDQDGNGIVRFASRRTIRYRDEWRAARESVGDIITAATPLFVAVHPRGNWLGKRLCHVGYHIALRGAVRTALSIIAQDEPDVGSQIDDIVLRISGHSFRVGMVEDLITAGETIVAICIEGGWATSTMPLMYGRNIDVRNGACARLRKKLGDE